VERQVAPPALVLADEGRVQSGHVASASWLSSSSLRRTRTRRPNSAVASDSGVGGLDIARPQPSLTREVRLIAASLYLAPSTVRNYLSSVFRKFGVNSQQQLIVLLRAQASGLTGGADAAAALDLKLSSPGKLRLNAAEIAPFLATAKSVVSAIPGETRRLSA
jgi:hypothetical protein